MPCTLVPRQLSSTLLESLQFVSLAHTGLTQRDIVSVYIAAEAHGWFMVNLLFTRTLRFFRAELFLDRLSTPCSAAQASTSHLSSPKFMWLPSAQSFSLLSTCQIAALLSSILTAPLSGITHKLSEGAFHPFNEHVNTVSVPASILWCNLA